MEVENNIIEIIKIQKKTKKDYNRTYYLKFREQIIRNACEKFECVNCCRQIARKSMKSHQKTKLCHKQTKLLSDDK